MLGDVIVAVAGDAVKHLDDLLAALGGDRVGTTVPVKIVRGGQAQEIKALIGERK